MEPQSLIGAKLTVPLACLSVDPAAIPKNIVKYVTTSPGNMQTKTVPVSSASSSVKVSSPPAPLKGTVVKTATGSSVASLPSCPLLSSPPSVKLSVALGGSSDCSNAAAFSPVSGESAAAMSTCRRNDAVTEDGILKVVTTENQLHQKTTLVPQADDQRGKRLLVSELPPNTVPPHNANIVDKDVGSGDTKQGKMLSGCKRRRSFTTDSDNDKDDDYKHRSVKRECLSGSATTPRVLDAVRLLSLDTRRFTSHTHNPRNRHFSRHQNILPHSWLQELCEVGEMFAIEEVSGAPTVKAALEARALDELEGWHVGGLLASQLDMWRAIEVLNRDHLSVSFTPHQHLPAPPTGISEPLHPHPSPTLTAAVGGSVRRQRASLDTLKKLMSKNEDLIGVIEDVCAELCNIDSLKHSLLSLICTT